jgi:predicted house-cleaning noncanonical NTP pyrophosphatase (MazG superfamily)
MIQSFDQLNSSAVKSVVIEDNKVEIIFNSSDKVYNYTIIDENFKKNLENTIENSESVGKYINTSIKEEKIQQITVESK